jgi:hypothetical protein
MGEARAKAAGDMGGPIRCGRKVGVLGAVSKGMFVPEGGWGKGTSKGVVAIVGEEGNGEDWLAADKGHCWGSREQGGGRVGPGCPKAAVTVKAEDIGSTAGGEKQKEIKGKKEKKKKKGKKKK